MGSYLYRVGVALSVLLNVILLGQSHQVFSARNYAWQKEKKLNGVWLIDKVLGKDHCRMAWVEWVTAKRKVQDNSE